MSNRVKPLFRNLSSQFVKIRVNLLAKTFGAYSRKLSEFPVESSDSVGGFYLGWTALQPPWRLCPLLGSVGLARADLIGFSTAITRAMDAIDRQRTTVGSTELISIFRVFGRDAGYTALYTAYVTALRCCIAEYKVDLKHLIDILIQDKRSNPSNYSLVILSEDEWQGYTVKGYGDPNTLQAIARK